MFRIALSIVLTVALIMTPMADVAVAESAGVQDLDAVNEQLQGKVADIDLANGTIIKKAKKVVVEPNFIYWKAKGAEQKIETGQVVRIRARPKSKGLIGMGVGAAGFALLSYGSGEGECEESDPWCTSDAEGGYALLAAGFGALVGFGIGKAIPRKRKVVYEAQSSPSVEVAPDQLHVGGNTP